MAAGKKPFYDDREFNYQEYWQSRQYENAAEVLALRRLFKKIVQLKKQPFIDSLLDIGAGYGRLAKIYLKYTKQAILLEPSAKLIHQGEKLLRQYNNFRYQQGSIEDLKKWPSQYQLILLIRVLHHLTNLNDVFTSIDHVLMDNGFVIIEIPNKLHFLQLWRHLLRLDWDYFNNRRAIDRRSQEHQKADFIPFRNYDPRVIKNYGHRFHWLLRQQLSVSNLRHPLLKKILGQKVLFSLEKISQKPLAPFYFGPSIFLLFQKLKAKT